MTGFSWEDIGNFIHDQVVAIINYLIEIIGKFMDMVAGLLPEWHIITPQYDGVYSEVINYLNWVFPVSFAMDCIAAFSLSVISYFTIGILTRWVKVTN